MASHPYYYFYYYYFYCCCCCYCVLLESLPQPPFPVASERVILHSHSGYCRPPLSLSPSLHAKEYASWMKLLSPILIPIPLVHQA